MQDVAALAGVSTKTVSRVFNQDPHVRADTRRAVQEAMRALGYVPNLMAKSLRVGRASVIGVAVPDIADPFFGPLAKEIELVARENGLAVVVTSIGDDPSAERDLVESMIQHRIAALVMVPMSEDQSYLSRWHSGLPMVFVDREPSGITADSFIEDNHGGAFAATAHLLEHGHRRIAFIGDSTGVPTTRKRLEGYLGALAEAGIDVDGRLIALGFDTSEEAARASRALLEIEDPPTAVFSSNVRFSMGVFPVLQERRGHDVALISFGDFPMADMLEPSVTVIRQTPRGLGRAAAERIIRRLADATEAAQGTAVLPVELIERTSCQSAPVPERRRACNVAAT